MTIKKNAKGAGRKKKLYNEQVILNLIYNCIDEKKIVGKVKYQEVYPYCLELYENKRVDFKLSEDYWRKPGRQGYEILKQVNSVATEDVEIDEEDIVSVVNTEDAINKLYDGKEANKKKLLNMLNLNEVNLRRYIKECKKLNNKIDILEEKFIIKNQDVQEWKNKAEELQRQLFLILEYSESKNFPIVNLLNTGETRIEPVNKQLETLFGDNPTIGYEYKQYIEEKSQKLRQQDKVTQLADKKQKSAADDFGLF
jgi:hypothetical protein